MWFSGLPARDLEPAELRALVDALADTPEVWRSHAGPGDGERHFASLHRDDHIDVWVIAWSTEGDTGWHDHDVSSGAVRVVEGALRESCPRLGGAAAERVLGAGTSFCFGPEHIHRLCGEAGHSVSLHAYSPPLERLGQYAIGADGVLRRVSVSYTDELRPREEPVAA
jgi:hypothetical protein